MLKELLENNITINADCFEVTMNKQLSREQYETLKHYFELIEGEYKTSGKKFVFKINPKPFIDAYIATGIMPIKSNSIFSNTLFYC